MKLLDQVRDVLRKRYYSIRIEQAYVDWIKRYIFFHGKRHPQEMVANRCPGTGWKLETWRQCQQIIAWN
jgi:Phage integrase, N-terminal SAM-like domain